MCCAKIFFDLHIAFGRKQTVGDLDNNPHRRISHDALRHVLNPPESWFQITENIEVPISLKSTKPRGFAMNVGRSLAFSFSSLHVQRLTSRCVAVRPDKVSLCCHVVKTRLAPFH